MEITMYEDGSFNNLSRERESLAQMKRKFTLDLNGRSSKKIRSLGHGHHQPNFNALLTSPDLNMLKLESPELDKLVMQNGGLLNAGFHFPTPSNKAPTPTTVSREEFVKGFEDTLDQMHLKDNSCEPVVTTNLVSSTAITSANTVLAPVSQPQYTQLEVPIPQPHQSNIPLATCNSNSSSSSGSYSDDNSIYIKEEPQTVPSVCGTPPMSPINMEDQEKIKLERKRMRNRIAASKCRRRKLERISRLEDKVNNLKSENSELQSVVNRMREQVCILKEELMQHVNSGCQIPLVTQQ